MLWSLTSKVIFAPSLPLTFAYPPIQNSCTTQLLQELKFWPFLQTRTLLSWILKIQGLLFSKVLVEYSWEKNKHKYPQNEGTTQQHKGKWGIWFFLKSITCHPNWAWFVDQFLLLLSNSHSVLVKLGRVSRKEGRLYGKD